MDSFEFNKIAGAVLATALVVFGLRELASVIYHSEAPEKPGFAIAVEEASTGAEAGGEATAAVPLGTLLASADPAKGETTAKQCLACHDFTKGGPNKVGPNLWDIVERPPASHTGFAYSDAMKAKASEKWTFEALDQFIKSPKETLPGTKMVFGGLKRDQARADLLAYLAKLSDAPKPFPAP